MPPKITEEKKNPDTQYLFQILDRVDKEIGKVHSFYKILIGAVTIVIAVGIWCSYKYLNDFKIEIKETGEHTQKQVKDDTDKFLISSQQDLKKELAKVEQEVTGQINEEFKKEQISKLVQETAQQRIDKIADELIKKQIETQIAPLRKDIQFTKSSLEEKLQNIQESEKELSRTLSESHKALEDIKLQSEFMMTFFAAQCDDRSAYDKLCVWGKDPSFPMSKQASMASLEINKSYTGLAGDKPYLAIPLNNTPYVIVPWNDKTKLEKLSPADIRRIWNTEISSSYSRAFVELVWNNNHLTKEEKLEFLYSVLSDSKNSLAAVDRAAHILSGEAKVQYNPPFNFEDIKKWWETIQSTKEDTGKVIDTVSK